MRFVKGRRLFGNGTRFVWHGGGAQKEHILQCALVIEVKASLVSVHEAEGRLGGEVHEGSGYAIQRIGGRLSGGPVFRAYGSREPSRGGDASGKRPSRASSTTG